MCPDNALQSSLMPSQPKEARRLSRGALFPPIFENKNGSIFSQDLRPNLFGTLIFPTNSVESKVYVSTERCVAVYTDGDGKHCSSCFWWGSVSSFWVQNDWAVMFGLKLTSFTLLNTPFFFTHRLIFWSWKAAGKACGVVINSIHWPSVRCWMANWPQ